MHYDREALLRELKGYERTGKKDRAAAVRALLGVDEPAPVEQASAEPGERRMTRKRG